MQNEKILIELDEQFLNKFFGITDEKYCLETLDLLKLKQQLEVIEDELIDHKIEQLERYEIKQIGDEVEVESKSKGIKNALVVTELGIISHQVAVIFKKMGANVVVVKNAYDAQDVFERDEFDFVVMDLAIPNASDGFALLDEFRRIIKNSDKTCEIGVISSYSRQEDKKKAIVKGAKFYIENKLNWQETLEKEIKK